MLNDFGNGSGSSFINNVKAYTTSKGQILGDYTRYTNAAIARARLPYAKAGAALPLPNNEFVRAIAPVFNKAREKDAECRQKNDFLMLEFALRAYRLEHGGYPETLVELVPGYLQTVPLDPFGAGEILKYQRQGDGYTLYSNGQNGIDDHGTLDDIVLKKP